MKNNKLIQEHKLWQLFGDLEKITRLEVSLEPLLALAVIAKLSPGKFRELYKSPRAEFKENLISIIESDKKLQEMDPLDCLDKTYLSSDVLVKIVYFLNEIDNFSELADVLLYGISRLSGKRRGEVITTRSVVEIIKRYVGDVSNLKIYDGAAGVCALTSQLNVASLVLEEKNSASRNMGKNLLLLKDIHADYRVNDSLLKLQPSVQADLVITQPPWGMRFEPGELQLIKNAKYLLFGKNEKIPVSAGDALWIQHALYHTNENGRVIMLLPHGWLFRGGYDADLREYLLEHDLIQAIIGLPAGLMQHTSIPSVMLILNKSKEKSQQGIVHFVDASGFGSVVKKQKVLTEEEIELIVSLAKGEQKKHEKYRAALLPEIYQNKNDLNIKRYIENESEIIENSDPHVEMTRLNDLEEKFIKAQSELFKQLNEANQIISGTKQ